MKPDVFPNVAAVLRYLRNAGWKVTKPTLYRHAREGKLPVRKDGSVARSVVDRYAERWLKPADPDDMPALAVRTKRLHADLARARERVALARSRVDRLAKTHVLREQVVVDLIARKALFSKHLPDLAGRIVRVAASASGGDMTRADEATSYVLACLNRCIEVFANDVEGDD